MTWTITRSAADVLTGCPGFIERYGHVPYVRVARKPQHWRIAYIQRAGCEFSIGLESGERRLAACRHPVDTFVFDHCHQHGWVRGVLCNGHNVKLGYIELVMGIEGVTVDLGVTPYARWIARCPGCSKTALLPCGEEFRPLGAPRPKMAPRPILGPAVARPSATACHLRSDARRTVCGLVADAMVATEGKPLCRICARRQEAYPGRGILAAEAKGHSNLFLHDGKDDLLVVPVQRGSPD